MLAYLLAYFCDDMKCYDNKLLPHSTKIFHRIPTKGK